MVKIKKVREQLASIRRIKNVRSAKIEDGKLILRTVSLPLLRRKGSKVKSVTKLVMDLGKMAADPAFSYSDPRDPAYPLWYYRCEGEWVLVCKYYSRHILTQDTGRLCIGQFLAEECRQALREGDMATAALAVMLVVNDESKYGYGL